MTDYLERTFDLDDVRTPSAFDEVSLWSARFGALLFDQLELQKNINILDLGCGTGFPLFELAYMHGATCRVFGIDMWRAALVRATDKRDLYELPNVGLACGDAAHLPVADDAIDLVVSNVGINNFADPPAALAECGRVLRPGGRFVMTTNVKGHMQLFYDVFRTVLLERRLDVCVERLAANEDHRLNRTILKNMLGAAGFDVTRIVEERFALRFADEQALFRHMLIVVGFLDGWRAVIAGEPERDIFKDVEARLRAIAERQGELRMMIPMLYIEARSGG